MKRKYFFVIFLFVAFSACSQENKVQKEERQNDLGITIAFPSKSFIQFEPVPLRIEIENCSDKNIEVVRTLGFEIQSLFVEIRNPEGKFYSYKSFFELSLEKIPTIFLEPNERLLDIELLTYSRDKGFVFDKTGKYEIQAEFYNFVHKNSKYRSNVVDINITEPKGVDKDALKLFNGKAHGHIMASLGQDPQAVKDFHRLYKEYPKSRYAPYAGYFLMKYYFRKEDYAECIRLCEDLLKKYPDFLMTVDTKYYMGVAFQKKGENEKADKIFKELISKYPDEPQSRYAEEKLNLKKSK